MFKVDYRNKVLPKRNYVFLRKTFQDFSPHNGLQW